MDIMKNEFKLGDRVISVYCETPPNSVVKENLKKGFGENIGTVISKGLLDSGVWVKFDRSFSQANIGPDKSIPRHQREFRYFFFSERRDGVDGLRYLRRAQPYNWKKL